MTTYAILRTVVVRRFLECLGFYATSLSRNGKLTVYKYKDPTMAPLGYYREQVTIPKDVEVLDADFIKNLFGIIKAYNLPYQDIKHCMEMVKE